MRSRKRIYRRRWQALRLRRAHSATGSGSSRRIADGVGGEYASFARLQRHDRPRIGRRPRASEGRKRCCRPRGRLARRSFRRQYRGAGCRAARPQSASLGGLARRSRGARLHRTGGHLRGCVSSGPGAPADRGARSRIRPRHGAFRDWKQRVTPAPDGRCTPPEPVPDPAKWPGLAQCPLFRGPFYLLGASVRDDRRKILELCEQRALSANAEACGKACADLISPRRRLAAELGWFPGVAPGRAARMLGLLRETPHSVRAECGFPPLARANLTSALWSTVRVTDPPAKIAALMQETATLASKVSAPEIQQAINADRSISGFPPVASSDDVEAALAE